MGSYFNEDPSDIYTFIGYYTEQSHCSILGSDTPNSFPCKIEIIQSVCKCLIWRSVCQSIRCGFTFPFQTRPYKHKTTIYTYLPRGVPETWDLLNSLPGTIFSKPLLTTLDLVEYSNLASPTAVTEISIPDSSSESSSTYPTSPRAISIVAPPEGSGIFLCYHLRLCATFLVMVLISQNHPNFRSTRKGRQTLSLNHPIHFPPIFSNFGG